MSELIKAYAQLQSLKENMPHQSDLSEVWVDDYHSILDKIEKATGENLAEFRVSDAEFRHRTILRNRVTGQTRKARDRTVPLSRFLVKLDAVMGYFRFLSAPPEKQQIGFKKI